MRRDQSKIADDQKLRGLLLAGVVGFAAAVCLNLALALVGGRYAASVARQIPTKLTTPEHSSPPPVVLAPGVVSSLDDHAKSQEERGRENEDDVAGGQGRAARVSGSSSSEEAQSVERPGGKRPGNDHGATSGKSAKETSKKSSKKEKKEADTTPAIATFSIDRAALNQQFRSLGDLAAHGRYLPNEEGEERRGLKFVAVAPGGIFAQLGFRQGDVVLSVNGVALNTQQDILANFDKMRKMPMLTLALERDGVRVQHRYILK